jgi:Zn-dependent protease with chaperone function
MEDYAELLTKNNRTNKLNLLVQYVVIVVDILLLGLFLKSGFGLFSIIFFLVIVFISSYGNILFLKKTRLETFDTIGKYSREEVKAIITEIFSEINKKEKPNIYIINSSTVNAFVTESIIKGVAPLNGLYLSEDLFTNLKTEELKSVIYHELGHYYYFMSPFSKNILPLDIFSVLFPFFVFLISNFKSVISLFFLVFFFSAFVRYLTFKNIKDNEYLSDFFSAQKNGLLNIVNGLIVVSKINEIDSKIVRYLVERITRDKERLSFQDFDFYYETLRKEIPYEFQNFDEISELIDNFLYDDSAENIPEINKESYYYEEIDGWDKFDLNHDFRISEEEYPLFIETLINSELNETEEQKILEERYNITHPTLRNRILFLEDNREYLEI